jgi:hypothetical protein
MRSSRRSILPRPSPLALSRIVPARAARSGACLGAALLGVALPPFIGACASDAPAEERAPRPAPTGTAIEGSYPPPAPAVDPEVAARLRADVAWLADDAREGRRAGTAGEAEAARWIAARFAELGLEPAGTVGYLQPFEVPLPPRDGGESVLRIPGAGVTAEPGALAPLFCAEAGTAEGEVVFCGYGIADPGLGRDDFAAGGPPVDGAGRIALIARGVPPYPPAEATGPGALPIEPDPHAEDDTPPTSWEGAGSLFLKVMNAKRRGFDAVLVAQHPDEEGAIPAFDPSQGARAGLPALVISAAVAEAVMPGYAERVRESDEARRADAPVATARHAAVRADVRREDATATNVLGLVPGKDRRRVVVVGAHFDHLGRGGPGSLAPDELGAIHNGADDNASGTAVVLELARRWAAAPESPPATLLFALWSGEELGLLGSEHWAGRPTVAIGDVAANLNLDMVGRAGDGKLSVLGAGSSAPFAGWLAEAGPRAGLELDVSLSGQGLGGSDHQVFLRRQVPALHLFSGVHPDYHKPTDDVERFEADGAARVATLAEDLADRLMTVDELAFVAPPMDTGNTEQPERRDRGWSVWFGTVPEYVDVQGLKLAGTSSGSPAEKAGLLAGDVIVQVGDVEIESIHDFVYMLQVYKPGDVVLTRYLRDGVEHEVRVTLATRAAE